MRRYCGELFIAGQHEGQKYYVFMNLLCIFLVTFSWKNKWNESYSQLVLAVLSLQNAKKKLNKFFLPMRVQYLMRALPAKAIAAAQVELVGHLIWLLANKLRALLVLVNICEYLRCTPHSLQQKQKKKTTTQLQHTDVQNHCLVARCLRY